MKKVILKVGGMSCSACSIGLEKFLNKQDDIIKASVNLVLGQVFIEYQDSTSLEQLADYIDKAGFIFEGVYDPKKKEKEQHKLIYLIIYAILAMIILYVSMSHMIGLPAIPILDMHNHPIYYATALLVLTIPYLLYGYDLFKSGFKNLIHKTPNMDTLVSLGVLASFGYSLFSFIKILYGQHQYIESLYFESCAIIIFFVKLV